jgi:hypothetical protein
MCREAEADPGRRMTCRCAERRQALGDLTRAVATRDGAGMRDQARRIAQSVRRDLADLRHGLRHGLRRTAMRPRPRA